MNLLEIPEWKLKDQLYYFVDKSIEVSERN